MRNENIPVFGANRSGNPGLVQSLIIAIMWFVLMNMLNAISQYKQRRGLWRTLKLWWRAYWHEDAFKRAITIGTKMKWFSKLSERNKS